MKPIFFVCFFSLFVSNSFSQHAHLDLSDEFHVSGKEHKDQTIAHSIYYDNYFYTATNSGIGGHYKWAFSKLYDMKFGVSVAKFDRMMNKVAELDLRNGDKVFGPLEPQLILLNNKLILAYFQSDNNTSFDLYLSEVDQTSLALKAPKKIYSIQQENVGIFKMESVIHAHQIFVINSADNTRALIVCNASASTMQAIVVDADLNIVRQDLLHTNTTGFDISSAVLTNDGLECLVLESDHETKIVCNNAEGKKSEMKFSQSGNLLPYSTRADLARDGKNIYIYASTTAADEDKKNCTGLMLAELDCSAMKLSKPLTYQFTPEQLEKVSEKGGGTKHHREYLMYNFTPDLMELGNGSLVILGCPEQVTNSSHMSAPNMNNQSHMVSTTTFEIGPVLAFFLNPAGKTVELAVVPRNISTSRSASSGTGSIQWVQSPSIVRSYANFSASRLGDEIVIIYNDTEKNLARSEDDKVAGAKSTGDLVLAEALINKDKKLEYRKEIGEDIKGRYTYFLGNTVPTSSASIVFPVAKQGEGFNSNKLFFSHWCFLSVR